MDRQVSTLLFLTTSFLSSAIAATETHHAALNQIPNVVHNVHNSYQCNGMCTARSDCVSSNYDVQTRLCELFFDTDGRMETKPNSVYREVSNNGSNNSPNLCDSRICQSNEVCTAVQNNGYQCLPVLIDCGEPCTSEGAAGIYTSTSLWSVTVHECQNGYKYVAGSKTTVCETDGRWTVPTIKCRGN